jgi:hypothetical protein
VRLKNSKPASTNGLLRYGSDAVRYCAASHAFNVATGVDGASAPKLLRNDGCITMTCVTRSSPCARAQAVQSNPGISLARSANASLL